MLILEVSCACPDEKYPLNGIFEFDQAKALAQLGHTVVFAAVDVRSVRRWRRWGVFVSRKDGIPVYNFDFPVGAVKKLDAAAQKWGFKLLYAKIEKDFGRPDIVHVHFGDVAGCVVDTCLDKKIPYVVTEHSSAVNRDSIDEKFRETLTRTYSNAARVVAVSSALGKRIKKHTGVDAAVIPNIVDLSLFTPDADRKMATDFTYLSAGNLVPSKGFDLLIRVFRRVAQLHPNAKLIIMGGGSERAKLESLISGLGLDKKVNLYGRYTRAEFARELHDADVFALPSRSETFGVVYAEAMAGGVPVIATRCGGPEDFVDAENGLLVDADDEEGLYEAMIKIASDTEKYDGKAMSERVRESFSDRAVARKLTELFEEIRLK